MKTLFIYSLQEIETPNKPLRSQEQIQFGISYISSLLKQNGHLTDLVVLSRNTGRHINIRILENKINSFLPQLVCFTAVSSEYHFIEKIARYVKSHFKGLYLLIGGPHASLNPDKISMETFDALCVGEGEYPTLELTNRLERGLSPAGISNFWIKKRDGIEKNAPRPFLENLDTLPYPDREMWQQWLWEQPDSQHSVLLGRGCPFECAYCSNHALKNLATGRYVRIRSTEKIINELKELDQRFPGKREVYFEIETFGINLDWALDLCAKIEVLNQSFRRPFSFGVNLRVTPNTDYSNLFLACKKSNFKFINIGLESGSERIRSKVLRRQYSNRDIVEVVKLARYYGLKIAFFNLVGIPGETLEDFKETIKINRICAPDWVMTSIFYPYPGTDLYSLCKDEGLIGDSLDSTMERCKAVIDLRSFPKKEVQNNYDWFYYNIYKDSRPLYDIWFALFIMKLRHWPFFFKLYKFIKRNHYYNLVKCKIIAVFRFFFR